jgi:hypothetical protein
MVIAYEAVLTFAAWRQFIPLCKELVLDDAPSLASSVSTTRNGNHARPPRSPAVEYLSRSPAVGGARFAAAQSQAGGYPPRSPYRERDLVSTSGRPSNPMSPPHQVPLYRSPTASPSTHLFSAQAGSGRLTVSAEVSARSAAFRDLALPCID